MKERMSAGTYFVFKTSGAAIRTINI